MSKPEKKPLSAHQKEEIREEVERQLTKIPGETLLWVQKEIRESIDNKTAELWRLALVVGGFAAVIATILGVSWANVQSKFKETSEEFDAAQRNLFARYIEVTNLTSALSNRFEELQKMDNIVTTTQLKQQLETVETLREQAQSALITALRLAAMEGDASAYDELRKLQFDGTRLGNLAVWAVLEIESSLTGPFNPDADDRRVTREWDYSLGFDVALNQYQSARQEEMISIIETIWTRTNYPKSKRMEFLVEAAIRCPSIQGRVVATRLLNAEVKSNAFNVKSPDNLHQWWATNKARFNGP